jgi:F-type H+-transporting ATPase subunit b
VLGIWNFFNNMDELIKTFHIDWKLLIAQGVNFLIVLTVLYFFALKPLMKIMHERAKKIEESLKNADLIETNLKNSEEEKQKKINEGRRAAQTIISDSEKSAEDLRRQKIDKTKAEVEKIIKDAKAEIEQERLKMVHGVKSELGDLVLLASNKLTGATLDEKKHHDLIEKVIEELKKNKIEETR